MSPRKKPRTLYAQALGTTSGCIQKTIEARETKLNELVSFMASNVPQTLQSAIGTFITNKVTEEAIRLPPAPIVKLALALKSRKLVFSGNVVEVGVLDQEDASHVRSLSLHYAGSQSRIPKVVNFLSTAVSLTHLEGVDFFDDFMMSVMAMSCPSLQSISLRNCPVTDMGIVRLCGLNLDIRSCLEQLDRGMELSPLSACVYSLREFKFTMTRIGDPGVVLIFLLMKNLRSLQIEELRIPKVFKYLEQQQDWHAICNLRLFEAREPLDKTKVVTMARVCPLLENIYVECCNKTEQDGETIEELRALKHLKSVKFANINSFALKSFIEYFGPQLRKLYLKRSPRHRKYPNQKSVIDRAHLRQLAKSCKNIEHLMIEDYCLEGDDAQHAAMPYVCFKKLRTLYLKSVVLMEDDLKVFLNESTELRELELDLSSPDIINDGFIEKVLSRATWNHLCRLMITNSSLTSDSLLLVVKKCPSLVQVGHIHTWLIPRTVAQSSKQWITSHNYDLQVS